LAVKDVARARRRSSGRRDSAHGERGAASRLDPAVVASDDGDVQQTDAPDAAGPIFIVSWVRSGSTLLRYLIDTHPAVACPAEIELGPLCERLLATLVLTADPELDEHRQQADSIAQTRQIVGEVMSRYARRRGRRIWADKSPLNVQHLETLRAVFPRGRFICLYRDGVDVVHSCVEHLPLAPLEEMQPFVDRAGGDAFLGAVDGWLDAVDRMLAFEQRHAGATWRVTYEALVRDPNEVLRALFAWLGLAWDPDLVERAFVEPHDEGPADPKTQYAHRIETSSVGRGRSAWSCDLEPSRRRALDERLAWLGYQPAPSQSMPGAAEADDPAAAEAVTHFFRTTLPQRLRAAWPAIREIGGTFAFTIHSVDAAQFWFLDLDGPKPYLAPVQRGAACALSCSATTLAAILAGHQNPVAARMEGRLRIEGDEESARVFAHVLAS
jgi:hypothetical protein